MALLSFLHTESSTVQSSSSKSIHNGNLRSCLKRSDSDKSTRSWMSSPPTREHRQVTFGKDSVKLIRPLFDEDLWIQTSREEINRNDQYVLQTKSSQIGPYVNAHSKAYQMFERSKNPTISGDVKKLLVQGAKSGFRTLERHWPCQQQRKLQAYRYVHVMLLTYKQTGGRKGWENKCRSKLVKLSHAARNFALFMGGIDEAAAREPLSALLSPHVKSIAIETPAIIMTPPFSLSEKKEAAKNLKRLRLVY